MPYETNAGTFEKASRLGHSEAALRAMADKRDFYVPFDDLTDASWLADRIIGRPQADPRTPRLESAIAIDGSHVTHSIRDGMPSVVYGFAQAAAAYVDLNAMEQQRKVHFTDPAAIADAVNSSLISLDLPVAGAYSRAGVDIQTSWRELIDGIFRDKRVEVNGLNETLMQLLFRLHGTPDIAATLLPVNCPNPDCNAADIPVPDAGLDCPVCWVTHLYPSDTMRLHESVVEDGPNATALGRMRSVVELLVLVGLTTLLWKQSRNTHLQATLFIMDGPLAMYGEPAKLRARAQTYFQAMSATTPGVGPYICGIEKSGAMVDFAKQVAAHDILAPGQLLICDTEILKRVTNTNDPAQYGKETYWGRKFIYRCTDGRVIVPTVMADSGDAYSTGGGQPGPDNYETLGAILDVIDRTGSSMYRNGVIPVAAAHGRAAFPIGVGTDVLKLVAEKKLGFSR